MNIICAVWLSQESQDEGSGVVTRCVTFVTVFRHCVELETTAVIYDLTNILPKEVLLVTTDLTSDIVCGPAAAAIAITGCFLIGIAIVIVSAVTLFRIKRLDTFQVQDDDTPQCIEIRIVFFLWFYSDFQMVQTRISSVGIKQDDPPISRLFSQWTNIHVKHLPFITLLAFEFLNINPMAILLSIFIPPLRSLQVNGRAAASPMGEGEGVD